MAKGKQETIEKMNTINEMAKFLYLMMFDEKTDIEIKLNSRLKKTLGQFVIVGDDEGYYIDLSKLVINQDWYVIADILSHELIHFYLWKNDLPYYDKDETFINMVRKFGVLETNTCIISGKKLLYEYYKHKFECNCGFVTYGYELINDNNFRMKIECPNCKKTLTGSYEGKIVKKYDPTFHIGLCVEAFFKKLENEAKKQEKKRKVAKKSK